MKLINPGLTRCRNRIKVTSLPSTPVAVSSSSTHPTTVPPPPPTYSPTVSAEPTVDAQSNEEYAMPDQPDDTENEHTPEIHSESIDNVHQVVPELQVETEQPRSRAQFSKNAELDSNNNAPEMPAEFPWIWARNIMLEKPVLKTSARL